MTTAENYANKSQLPSQFEGAEWVSEMKDIITSAFATVEDLQNNGGELVPAVRYQRDDEGNTILDDDNTPSLMLLTDESGETVMEPHPLLHRLEHHGLHAYRYEVMEDGSVLAIYVNDPSAELKFKAFPDLETASLWSPRDER